MKKIEFKIGGKSHTGKLGLRFLENVTKTEGISVIEALDKFDNDSLLFIPKLIFHSINTATPESITLDEVYDWVDETGLLSDEIKPFITMFSESILVHLPQDKAVGKPKAKK